MYGVSRKETKQKALNEKSKNNIEKGGGLPMPLALPQPTTDDVELKANENVIDGIRNRAFVEEEQKEKDDEDNKVINEAIEIVKEIPTIHVESYRLWYIIYFLFIFKHFLFLLSVL